MALRAILLVSRAIVLAAFSSAARSQTFSQTARYQPTDETIIVTAPGGLLDRDETQSIGAGDIAGSGHRDLLSALSRSIPGVSLQEAQGNPFQPNLVYRGFTASPLQGQPQGLAVYLDGGRFNQPFGDTVQFDLLPEAAIQRLDIVDANPVYGLNALGGAIVIETKTGRDAPGVSLSADAGAFGQSQLVGEAGWRGQHVSAYIAVQHSHDGGWRRFSPSSLTNGFADLGWEGESAGVHFKLLGADTDLTGNGTAPIELLRADYRAIFTTPDITRHRYGRASLHPWADLGSKMRLQASLYWQQLKERTVNGDAADIAACDDDQTLLCLEDDAGDQSPLLDPAGQHVASTAAAQPYGVLNLSRSTSRAAGILTQLTDKRRIGGHRNTLALGFSLDGSDTRFASNTELGTITDTRAVTGGDVVIAQPDGLIAPVSLTAGTRALGLFASDRFDLTSKMAAELDLRWNDASIRLHDRIGTALDGSHQFRRLNPGVQLDWQVATHAVLRAGYSESNRAPTPAELACADPSAPCSLTNFFVGDPALHQVVSHSFQLGGQGKLASVQWLVSGYRSTNSDDIQDVASDIRGRAYFQNVGSTRRQGFEVTLGYTVNALTVRAGYAFTDATFRSPLLLNSPDNPQADANGQIAVVPGDRLPGIPRHRAVLSADYERKSWSIGGDVQVASNQRYFGDEANLTRPLPGYVIANLRGSVALTGPLRLFGEVRNLFDRHYATFGTFAETGQVFLKEAPGASNPRAISPAAPRRWLVGIKSAF